MLTAMERELSLKSDHEIRIEKDKIYKKLVTSGEADETDLEQASAQTAAEFEDACLEELSAFNATQPQASE